MKKVAKKLLSLVVVVCIAFMGVFAVPTFGAKAATTDETLSVIGTTGVKSGTSISWTGTNLKFENTQANGSAAIRNSDSDHYRVYKGSIGTLSTVDADPIVKAVFTMSESKYASVCAASFKSENAVETSYSGTTVTITPTETVSSLSYKSTEQWRLSKVVVTYGTVTEATVTVKGEASMFIDGTQTLEVVAQNVEGTPTWTSSNEDVATVDANGEVTAKAMGTTTITANVNGTTGSIEIAVWPSNEGTLTIAEAIALANTRAHNTYTDPKYYVEGTVSDVYNIQYGNFHLVDAEGNDLIIYGLYSANGKTRYDSMTVKPVEGDFVRVYGILGTYSSKPQMKDAWLMEHRAAPTAELNEVDSYMSLSYAYEQNGETLENSSFRIRFGVDAALAEIEGISAYGIQVTAGGNTVNYTTTAASWTVADGIAYVIIDLGDIIGDMDKLNTEFTVAAYVVFEGMPIVSTATKTYSVASMIAEYYEAGYDVEHLYNYLNA